MDEKDLMKILEGKERSLYLIRDTCNDSTTVVSLTREQVSALKNFLAWAGIENDCYIQEINRNITEW